MLQELLGARPQAPQTTYASVCTELSWHPNKDSDGNQPLNTTIQPCTLWLTNATHRSAHWNRKLNPTFAKTQELSPPRRQSCRWMHQITHLALLSSVALPPRQPGDALAFPSAMGKSSRECGRKVGVYNPHPSMGKASLPPWWGGQAAMDFQEQWGCQLYLWLSSPPSITIFTAQSGLEHSLGI